MKLMKLSPYKEVMCFFQEAHVEQPAEKIYELDFFGVAMIKSLIVLVYRQLKNGLSMWRKRSQYQKHFSSDSWEEVRRFSSYVTQPELSDRFKTF